MLPLTLYCNCPCNYYENIEKKKKNFALPKMNRSETSIILNSKQYIYFGDSVLVTNNNLEHLHNFSGK